MAEPQRSDQPSPSPQNQQNQQGDSGQQGEQPPQRRFGALKIARIAGVPVYVNVSWIFVALLIAYAFTEPVLSAMPELGPWAYAAAFFFAILLYLSVLVHEISHVLAARAFGLPVRSITLQFLGGVSEIEREPDTPWREFAVAVVGPLTSLAIGVVAYIGQNVFTDPPLLFLMISMLATANFLIGFFNLLPGLPLDGGRILRAIIWAISRKPHLGTLIAGWAGRVVAVLVLAVPWIWFAGTNGMPSILHIVWSVLIATFLWAGSTQALVSARVRKKLPALQARQLARRGVPVPPELPLSEAIRRAQEAQSGGLVVVDPGGRPVGLVSEAAVLATPEHRRPWVAVGDVARRIEPGLVISADLTGEALIQAMSGTPNSEYLLVEPDGQVYGILASGDVDKAFAKA
ncbi:site-2 protease family protein [Tenggerimyces flavus]|uniref:Zinc metalloprotease n=1 Tax=Tenggerimyces flavus TaxID=1708749 RepID=A0ABV7Y4G7_9ACTN|nr:site-2 protease family protein [Tenggerimyces flavus]MBM7788279.1 Zn-dependent protease [Tenggerimyces flavus]